MLVNILNLHRSSDFHDGCEFAFIFCLKRRKKNEPKTCFEKESLDRQEAKFSSRRSICACMAKPGLWEFRLPTQLLPDAQQDDRFQSCSCLPYPPTPSSIRTSGGPGLSAWHRIPLAPSVSAPGPRSTIAGSESAAAGLVWHFGHCG